MLILNLNTFSKKITLGLRQKGAGYYTIVLRSFPGAENCIEKNAVETVSLSSERTNQSDYK